MIWHWHYRNAKFCAWLNWRLAALQRFLIQERFDADAASFRSEMATKGVRTSKSATATPVVTVLQLAPTDELLLSRMQAFVALAVMLSRESFAAMTANKRALIGMGSQVRSKIVCARETLWAQAALESGWMLLSLPYTSTFIGVVGCRATRVGKVQYVVAVWYARCRRPPALVGWRG
jgi:hypothetical protein